MTKEELKQHCEKQVKMCEEWAKGNDREPSGKIYEEHKLILDLINALEQQPSDDCVSRADLIDKLEILDKRYGSDFYWEVRKIVDIFPPVTPTHRTCKDCKHWKDSDGVYRRGVGAESKCPINIKEVYEGNFYCADFARREE